MEAAAALVEAEHASEDAEEAEEAAEAAEAVAEAALDVATAALEAAVVDSDHEHGDYVRREELREIADAYVLELALLASADSEAGSEGEEIEEDVAPPSIEKPKKKSFAERWDGA